MDRKKYLKKNEIVNEMVEIRNIPTQEHFSAWIIEKIGFQNAPLLLKILIFDFYGYGKNGVFTYPNKSIEII